MIELPAPLTPADLREQIIGADATFATPYGERLMVYCDYTASGRCLRLIEDYLQGLQEIYANTHTEDDITGRSMSRLLHEAEAAIKAAVNAGPQGRLIACGTGATGAIDKLQQILGIALPPATRAALDELLAGYLGERTEAFSAHLEASQPVVFVGPYEHHSNEISWRLGLASVVEVGLDAEGGIDLAELERLLELPEYRHRRRIGSFSAASNVTGMRSDVYALATVLHRHGAIACFDYAAAAPYVAIDMNPPPRAPGDDPAIDAVFLSPHKFLGGPGASGILVFNERLYRADLAPSVSAGGTVDYVGPDDQDFIADIEEREKAGTPGVLQTLKAALAFQVKERVGIEAIEARERELTARALRRWAEEDAIEVLGHPDPGRRIGILSFNVRDPHGGYLHPKLVTALLNDLFGIQSRAGCSCAGPYGHRLLAIDRPTSQRYRQAVRSGHCGLKPGWCRLGLHYVMDDAEADYVIEAVRFVARHGHLFLPEYRFELATGTWTHRRETARLPEFGLAEALRSARPAGPGLGPRLRAQLYRHYLAEARGWAERLGRQRPEAAVPRLTRLPGELGELQFFTLPEDAPEQDRARSNDR